MTIIACSGRSSTVADRFAAERISLLKLSRPAIVFSANFQTGVGSDNDQARFRQAPWLRGAGGWCGREQLRAQQRSATRARRASAPERWARRTVRFSAPPRSARRAERRKHRSEGLCAAAEFVFAARCVDGPGGRHDHTGRFTMRSSRMPLAYAVLDRRMRSRLADSLDHVVERSAGIVPFDAAALARLTSGASRRPALRTGDFRSLLRPGRGNSGRPPSRRRRALRQARRRRAGERPTSDRPLRWPRPSATTRSRASRG